MLGNRSRLIIPSLSLHFISVWTLQFTTASHCETLCHGSSDNPNYNSTTLSDITCDDNSFWDSAKGIKFRNCLNCLQKSGDTNEEQSDVFSFLFNVRYAFDVCIFSYPEVNENGSINSICNVDSSCAPLATSLKTSLDNVTENNRYDYCDAKDSVLSSASYSNCVSCLQSTSNQTYFSNFLVALKAGCEQRPEVGDRIGLSYTLFESEVVNITASMTDVTSQSVSQATSRKMSTGAIVGIVVGCAVAFAGALGLWVLYARRRRLHFGASDLPPPSNFQQHMQFGNIQERRRRGLFRNHGTPGLLPAYNIEHQMGHGRKISITEYYNNLEKDSRLALTYHHVPNATSRGPDSALPAHPAYNPNVVSRIPEPAVEPVPEPELADPVTWTPPTTPPTQIGLAVSDSYTLQTYLASSEESSQVFDATISEVDNSRTSSRQELLGGTQRQQQQQLHMQQNFPTVPMSSQSESTSRSGTPTITFPSLAKMRGPRKYSPPPMTPGRKLIGPEQSELAISKPLAVLEPKFHEKPVPSGLVIEIKSPASLNGDYLQRRGENESPMSSGTSRLFG